MAVRNRPQRCKAQKFLGALKYDIQILRVVQWEQLWFSAPARFNDDSSMTERSPETTLNDQYGVPKVSLGFHILERTRQGSASRREEEKFWKRCQKEYITSNDEFGDRLDLIPHNGDDEMDNVMGLVDNCDLGGLMSLALPFPEKRTHTLCTNIWQVTQNNMTKTENLENDFIELSSTTQELGCSDEEDFPSA